MIKENKIKVELISWTRNPIETCSVAASTCYDSEPCDRIFKGCISTGHTSITEHANFTFKISGVSRALSHQLVRHRIASYSQQSQRYVDMENASFTIPTTIKNNPEALLIYGNLLEEIENTYEKLRSLDIPKEDCRMMLPNACSTEIVVTMNIRALMNFFHERLCGRAQWEIRILANKMKEALINCPDISSEMKEYFKKIFVPKCRAGKIHYCPEREDTCCGMTVTASALKKQLEGLSNV